MLAILRKDQACGQLTALGLAQETATFAFEYRELLVCGRGHTNFT